MEKTRNGKMIKSLQGTYRAKSICCPDKLQDCSVSASVESIDGAHMILLIKPVCEHVVTKKGSLRKGCSRNQRLSKDGKNLLTYVYWRPETMEALTGLLVGLHEERLFVPKEQRLVAINREDPTLLIKT